MFIDLFNLLFQTDEIVNLRLIKEGCPPENIIKSFSKNSLSEINNIIEERKDYNLYFGVMPRDKTEPTRLISRVNACFLDIDRKDFETEEAFDNHIIYIEETLFPELNLVPTAKVYTGNGYHYYFVFKKDEEIMIENMDVNGKKVQSCKQWKGIQIALIELCGGDPAIKDLPRIMRFSGSLNVKKLKDKDIGKWWTDSKFTKECQILELNPDKIYSLSDFSPLLQKHRSQIEENTIESCNEVVADYDCDYKSIILKVLEEKGEGLFDEYEDFLRFLFACKSEDIEYDQIDPILQKSDNYDYDKNLTLYESLKPNGITFGTAFYYAKKADETMLKELLSKNGSDTFDDIYFFTDTWSAERFVEQHGDTLRYCFPSYTWFFWNGKFWQEDRCGLLHRKIKQTIKSFYEIIYNISDAKKREKFMKHICSSESLGKRRAIASLAEFEDGMAILPEDLDRDKFLLNVNNGTINLKTGELYDHNQENYITKIINVNYVPYADCPLWKSFLSRIFNGNQDLIKFVQKAVGYSLTGSTQEQCIFILHGTGANGKSTFLTIISEILGDYAQQTPSETLLAKRNTGNVSNDIARLKGVRFVSSVETEEGRAFAEVLIKQLSGDDTITARFLHKEFFEFKPECKIFIGTNHKPRIKGTDNAIWRRIRLIPFEVTIPEGERDRHLIDKLRAEKEGILAWAVHGCRLWQAEGLKATDEIREATELYKSEMDVIAAFIRDCCIVEKDSTVLSEDLYKTYKNWCDINGEYELSQRFFGMKLTEKGFEKVKITKGKNRFKWSYKGIGITDENDCAGCATSASRNDIFSNLKNGTSDSYDEEIEFNNLSESYGTSGTSGTFYEESEDFDDE